jgi:serine/threonine-protein kinase
MKVRRHEEPAVPDLIACRQCGQAVSPAAPGGQCPACLLRLGLASTSRADDTPVNQRPHVGATNEFVDEATTKEALGIDHATVTAVDGTARTTAPGGPVLAGHPMRFGNYELCEEIGRGGMGVVFRAVQAVAGREVAVKVLLGGAAGGALHGGRFAAEVSALAQLRHPNIVAVYEVGEVNGSAFFSMEYAPNGTLAAKVRSGPLPFPEAAVLVGKLAEATEAAHRLGVLHRDIKPANVLIAADGDPKLSDFGLARWVHRDDALTASGAVMGTPSYMPPEQARGEKVVRPTADVYGLGATLYECLTGRPPFRGADAYAVIQRVLKEEPDAPRTIRPEVPPELEAICLKCLEKDAARRYASAQELAADLARWRNGESTVARPLKRWQRGWRRIKRKWRPIAAALLVAVGGGGIAFAVVPRDDRRADPPFAKIAAALKRGGAVTLVGSTGGPTDYRWAAGVGEVNGVVPNQPFLVRCEGSGLIELTPDSFHDRFRLTAEFQQNASLKSESQVGVYFGHKASNATPTSGADRAIVLHYADDLINNLPRHKIGDPVQLDDCVFVRSEELPCLKTSTPLRTHWIQEEKRGDGTRPWRKVVVEVTPDAIRAYWQDNTTGTLLLLNKRETSSAMVRTRLADAHRQVIEAQVPGLGLVGLDYDARGGVGLYLHHAQAYFRNVVLEPLTP